MYVMVVSHKTIMLNITVLTVAVACICVIQTHLVHIYRQRMRSTLDPTYVDDESNEEQEVQGPLFLRRPRQISRTRHIILRDYINRFGELQGWGEDPFLVRLNCEIF